MTLTAPPIEPYVTDMFCLIGANQRSIFTVLRYKLFMCPRSFETSVFHHNNCITLAQVLQLYMMRHGCIPRKGCFRFFLKNYDIYPTSKSFTSLTLFFTVRNEVAKVMFLHLSAGIPPSPQKQTPPPPESRHPPRSRHPPLGSRSPPREQAPPQEQASPPREQIPPPQQTATVVDGTHHTGMHSCLNTVLSDLPLYVSYYSQVFLRACKKHYIYVFIK